MKISLHLNPKRTTSPSTAPFKGGQPVLILTANKQKEPVYKTCVFEQYAKDKKDFAYVTFYNTDTKTTTRKLVHTSKILPQHANGDPTLLEPLAYQKLMRALRNYLRTPLSIGSVIEFRIPLPPSNDPTYPSLFENSKRIGVVTDCAKIDRRWLFTVEDTNSNSRFTISLTRVIRVISSPKIRIEIGKE